MSTESARIPSAERPWRHIARVSWMRQGYFYGSWVRAILFALPIALTAGAGVYRIVGLVYFFVWLAMLAPSTMSMLWIIFDSILLSLRRAPLALPRMIAATARIEELQRINPAHRRVMTFFDRLGDFTARANPIGNLAISAILTATRIRPDEVLEMWEAARAKGRAAVAADGYGNAFVVRHVIHDIQKVQPRPRHHTPDRELVAAGC